MNIFRTSLQTHLGAFLVDAIHSAGKVSKIRLWPILGGIVGAEMPSGGMEGMGELKDRLESLIGKG